MNSSSSRTAAGKGLDLGNFLLRFLDLTTHQELPKLSYQQELRGRVDKSLAQQYQDWQFESNEFQDHHGNNHKTPGSQFENKIKKTFRRKKWP
jgi:hypothetical protein